MIVEHSRCRITLSEWRGVLVAFHKRKIEIIPRYRTPACTFWEESVQTALVAPEPAEQVARPAKLPKMQQERAHPSYLRNLPGWPWPALSILSARPVPPRPQGHCNGQTLSPLCGRMAGMTGILDSAPTRAKATLIQRFHYGRLEGSPAGATRDRNTLLISFNFVNEVISTLATK